MQKRTKLPDTKNVIYFMSLTKKADLNFRKDGKWVESLKSKLGNQEAVQICYSMPCRKN